jgi:hypothetical protein
MAFGVSHLAANAGEIPGRRHEWFRRGPPGRDAAVCVTARHPTRPAAETLGVDRIARAAWRDIACS